MSDDAQTPLLRFDFTNGVQRGSQLMLYPRYLVHRSDSHVETVPFSRITALKVAFERDPRRLGWGVALVIVALLLLALAAPIGSLSHGAALGVLGWHGATTLTLVLGGAERAYSVRGRDMLLLDFAEVAAERLMATAR